MSLYFVIVQKLGSSIIGIPVLNANSEDLDQTPHSAASDLGLHCLSMSIFETLGIHGLKLQISCI